MIVAIKKIFISLLATQVFFTTYSSLSIASTCSNNWLRPSSQTMETEMMTASMNEYANRERYISIEQHGIKAEIYFLQGALLVKGLDDSQISYDAIFWLPMIFAMPIDVLSKAVPKGPCSVTKKLFFRSAKLEGIIDPVSSGGIVYEYHLKNNEGKNSPNNYKGKMKFTAPAPAPVGNTNIEGYKLVDGRSKHHTIIGGRDVPAKTIQELRSILALKAKDLKKSPREQAMKEQILDSIKTIVGPEGSVPDTMKKEEIVLAPLDGASSIDKEELYPLQIGNQRGYVNKSGYVMIEPKFDHAYFFEESLARVTQEGKWGVIDKRGQYIIKPQYSGIGSFEDDGLAWIGANKKIGFVDKKAEIIIPIEWDASSGFKNGVAMFRKNNQSFFIDRNLKEITEDQYCQKRECYHRVRSIRPFEENGKWGLTYSKNEIILKPTYDHIFEDRDKDGLFRVRLDKKYGFIDQKGNIVIYLQFEGASDFKEGVASVQKNGKWGFIDKTGNFVIEPKFDAAGYFEDGLAPAGIAKKWGLIDKRGSFIIEPQFESTDVWKSKPLSYNSGVWNIQMNGKWGLMDSSGKILISPQFDSAVGHFGESDFAVVEKNYKNGVVNKNGKIIIQTLYTSVLILPTRKESYAPHVFEIGKYPHSGYGDTSGRLFVITDKVCGRYVVKNGKGEVTWPRNIKQLCKQ